MGTSRNPQAGQVTVMHLLLAIAFVMPLSGAIAQLEHSGGGVLDYLIVLPLSLAVGALIVWLDWKLGKALWLRYQQRSRQVQNGVAGALFLFFRIRDLIRAMR